VRDAAKNRIAPVAKKAPPVANATVEPAANVREALLSEFSVF
jgi:hypothetical protein